jgi:hypothetical protein
MRVVVITVVKDDLFGLIRTEKSIQTQSAQVNWVLVTPTDSSVTHSYVQELIARGIVEEVIQDFGDGVYSAMNMAIQRFNPNDWIWFLNAGDEFASCDSYALISDVASKSPRRWIYGGHFLGSEQGQILGRVLTPKRFSARNQLFARKYVSHQSTVFRQDFLSELKGFRTEYKIAADWDLLVRASRVDEGERIPEIISVFYMGGVSTVERQIGNSELLKLRNEFFGDRSRIQSYYWYSYRWVRNNTVQLIERKHPETANRIRKIRLSLRLAFFNFRKEN